MTQVTDTAVVKDAKKETHFCSFCACSNKQCEVMITTGSVHICEQCVDICRDIVGNHRITKQDAEVIK